MVLRSKMGSAWAAWLLLPGLLAPLTGQVAGQTPSPVPSASDDLPQLAAAPDSSVTDERTSGGYDAPAGNPAAGGESMPKPPPYKSLRYDEDYRSGRLIAAREAPNNRRSFDAARLLFRAGDWAVDGFWGKPVRNRFHVFDDDPDPNKSLWGAYGVRPLSALPDGHADLYYLGFENKRAVFNQGAGYELRHTLGTRLWGKPLPWEYNVEILWQFGTFGTGNIEAWAVATNTHYTISDLPLRPRLGLTADITSGDQNPNTANLQTYNPLFPTGAYFNLADLGGPSNFIHLHPSLDLYFSETFRTTLDWGFFWRESVNDAVYSIGTFPIRPSSVGQQRYTGSSPAATMVWEPARHVTVLSSYVHFFPGPFFEAPPPFKSVDYFTAWVTYKF